MEHLLYTDDDRGLGDRRARRQPGHRLHRHDGHGASRLGVGAYVTATLNILLGVNFYFALLLGAVAARSPPPSCCRCGIGAYFALATLGVVRVFFDIFHNLAPRVEEMKASTACNCRACSPRPARVRRHAGDRRALCAAVPARGASPLGRARDARPAGCARRPRQGSAPLPDGRMDLCRRADRARGRPLRRHPLLYRSTLFTLDASILILVYRCRRARQHAGSVLGVILLIAFNRSLRFIGLRASSWGRCSRQCTGFS